jgi:hypothetical protein
MNQFVVQTIRLDDLLPILVERKVQSILIKIDIEGSQSQVFMMEWEHGFRKQYHDRYESIADFSAQRNYVATDPHCTKLSVTN